MSEEMERADHEIIHRASEVDLRWPNQLRTAEDIAPEVLLSPERLLDLANAGFAPHWRIDGGAPLFNLNELKKWGVRNIAYRCEGRQLPVEIRVAMSPTVYPAHDAPAAIRDIPGLIEIPSGFPTGVYFLVHDGEIVYVGQSINPTSRITSHIANAAKTFNRAFLVPVPASRLDAVEQALIRILKPRQNGPALKGLPHTDADLTVVEEYWPDIRTSVTAIRVGLREERHAEFRAANPHLFGQEITPCEV